jgi:CHRD domain
MLVTTVLRLLAALTLAGAVALVAASPGGAQSAPTKCTAYALLKPGNEVRGENPADPVDSRASGATLVHINGSRVSFTTAIANPFRETFTAGHIHVGARDANGPVVVELFSGSSDRRLFTQFASITDEDAASVCGNVGGHYVNYHTEEDPEGAIRGQLVQVR